MEASRIQPSSCQGRRSYSLLSRRLTPSQAKLRSTTQRRGCTTKPRVPSARRTISRSRRGQCWASQVASTSAAVRAIGPQLAQGRDQAQRLGQHPPRPRSIRRGPPDAHSTASRWPLVSTSRWRLRPFTFFPPIEPAGVGPGGPFGTLAVDDGGAGAGGSGPAAVGAPRAAGLHLFQRAAACPLREVVVHQAPVGILARQQAPLAAGAQTIQQGIDHRPRVAVPAPSPPGALGRTGARSAPIGVGQIGRSNSYPSIAASIR